jgi:hypothetical protein
MRKMNEQGNAIERMLKDLEATVEAYLNEWRQELGIQERSKASIDREER